MYGNEREVGAGLRALRHQARGRLPHHQGVVQPAGGGRLRALGRRKPGEAQAALCRSADDPLAERANSARGIDCRAVQGEKATGSSKTYRRRQFQHRHDRCGCKLATEPLAVLQIETHPYLDQTKVIAAARRHGMAVVGYCPLARGKVPGDETLQRIGRAHGKTASQVALRFLEQQQHRTDPAHLEARAARRKPRQSRFQAHATPRWRRSARSNAPTGAWSVRRRRRSGIRDSR